MALERTMEVIKNTAGKKLQEDGANLVFGTVVGLSPLRVKLEGETPLYIDNEKLSVPDSFKAVSTPISIEVEGKWYKTSVNTDNRLEVNDKVSMLAGMYNDMYQIIGRV